MKTARHPNPITQHQRNIRAQLPTGARGQQAKGVFGMRRDSRGLRGFHEPNRCRRGKVEEHVGLKLVQWFIDHDRKEQARELLAEIKAGKIDPKTGTARKE